MNQDSSSRKQENKTVITHHFPVFFQSSMPVQMLPCPSSSCPKREAHQATLLLPFLTIHTHPSIITVIKIPMPYPHDLSTHKETQHHQAKRAGKLYP
jgi:hypothetical protein